MCVCVRERERSLPLLEPPRVAKKRTRGCCLCVSSLLYSSPIVYSTICGLSWFFPHLGFHVNICVLVSCLFHSFCCLVHSLITRLWPSEVNRIESYQQRPFSTLLPPTLYAWSSETANIVHYCIVDLDALAQLMIVKYIVCLSIIITKTNVSLIVIQVILMNHVVAFLVIAIKIVLVPSICWDKAISVEVQATSL